MLTIAVICSAPPTKTLQMNLALLVDGKGTLGNGRKRNCEDLKFHLRAQEKCGDCQKLWKKRILKPQ